MKIQIRYFASLREALGPGEAFDVAEGTTLGGLRALLVARGGRHAEALGAQRPLRSALNQVMADDTAPLVPDAEVAFFPPVTGG